MINKHAFIILITGNAMTFALRLELDVEWSNALQLSIQNASWSCETTVGGHTTPIQSRLLVLTCQGSYKLFVN